MMSRTLLWIIDRIKPKAAAPAAEDSQSGMSDGRLRLAVIGAGPAGLVSAKHALARPDKFIVTVFEQNSQLGGTWVYTEQTTEDDQPSFQSAMYKSLKTNLPKQTMAFLDHPFPPWIRSFLSSEEVLAYLEDFAKRFNVVDHIKFNKRVVMVTPLYNAEHPDWIVVVEDVITKRKRRHFFDAVIVCNGHFNEPRYPDIPGLNDFIGFVIHSHDYRIPEPFRGLKVVCLGAGSSGVDISFDIASVAQVVYFSHKRRKPFIKSELPENMFEIDVVVRAGVTGFFTRSGEWYEANALVLCTGYLYAFPFLAPECQVEVNDNRVSPLYKHLVNIAHPTMAFVGLTLSICPFPTFDIQAQYFIGTLTGEIVLPSQQEMTGETETELQKFMAAGKPLNHTHDLGNGQWAYLSQLAAAVETSPPPPVIESIFNRVIFRRLLHPHTYREFEYVLLDGDHFREFIPTDLVATYQRQYQKLAYQRLAFLRQRVLAANQGQMLPTPQETIEEHVEHIF